MRSETVAGMDERNRVHYLDGLRGLAACIVAFDHFGSLMPWKHQDVAFLSSLLSNPPFTLLTDGAFSVYVFFALSGFVLAESTKRTKRTLPVLIVTRYLRLTIPMTISLVLAWSLLQLFTGARAELAAHLPGSFFQQYHHVVGRRSFASTLTDGVYVAYLTRQAPLNLVLWTMHTELIGSLAIYSIYKLTSDRMRPNVLALFTAATMLSPGYLGFAIGALFREAWARRRLHETGWGWGGLLLGVIIATLPQSVLQHLILVNHLGAEKSLAFGNSVAAALILYAVLSLQRLRLIFSAVIPLFLGRISFFFYLVHFPLMFSVVPWLALYVPWPEYTDLFALFAIYMALSIFLGWILTLLVDDPLTKTLRRINFPCLGFKTTTITTEAPPIPSTKN